MWRVKEKTKTYVFTVYLDGKPYVFTAKLPEEMADLWMGESQPTVCEGTVEYVVPDLIVDLGLLRVWTFLYDIAHFRNPFRD